MKAISTGFFTSITPIAPNTRTSATCGNKAAGASSLFNCDSIAFTFSSQLYESNNSTDAFATAQANGFPIKVGPCIKTPG